MESVYHHCRNKTGMNGVVVWGGNFPVHNLKFGQFASLGNLRSTTATFDDNVTSKDNLALS